MTWTKEFPKFILIVMIFTFINIHEVRAEKSGLLLGLRRDSKNTGNRAKSGNEPAISHSYRTLWIYPEGNSLVVKQGQNIIVPRQNGFWLVGVESLKKHNWTQFSIFAHPLGSRQKDTGIMPGAENTSGYFDAALLFVGDNYISAEGHSWGYTRGAAHPFEYHWLGVYSLDNLKKKLSIDQVFGRDSNDVLVESSKKYIKDHPDEKERLYEEGRTDSWGLIRSGGHWITRGFIDYSFEVFRGAYAIYDIPLTPPGLLVSYDRLSPSWKRITKYLPNATDAFSSPEGDILGVIAGKTLFLYLHRPGEKVDFREPTREIDLAENEFAVMIQWATGFYVDKWSEETGKSLR